MEAPHSDLDTKESYWHEIHAQWEQGEITLDTEDAGEYTLAELEQALTEDELRLLYTTLAESDYTCELGIAGVKVVSFVSTSRGKGRRLRTPRSVTLIVCNLGDGLRAVPWREGEVTSRLEDIARQTYGEFHEDPWSKFVESVERELRNIRNG